MRRGLQVVYVPRMPMNYGQQMEGPNALATLLGWLGMLQAALVPVTAKVVLLRIDLSQAEADKVRVNFATPTASTTDCQDE
jgi:hypothetical protein